MKRLLVVLLSLCLYSTSAYPKDKLLDMFFPDHTSSLFYFDAAVSYQPFGTVASGGFGLNFNAGLNIGRLFHKNLVIAPFGGVAPCFFDAINSGFINDLKNNYEKPARMVDLINNPGASQQNIEDSAAYSDADSLVTYLMAGQNLEKFTITMRYGVLLKLPWKYCPPIAVYNLFRGTSVMSSSTRVGYNTAQSGSKGIWATGRGLEIYLFRGSSHYGSESMTGTFHTGSLALTVEMTDMKTAIVKFADTTYKTPDIYLFDFTKAGFDSKYAVDWRIALLYNIHIL